MAHSSLVMARCKVAMARCKVVAANASPQRLIASLHRIVAREERLVVSLEWAVARLQWASQGWNEPLQRCNGPLQACNDNEHGNSRPPFASWNAFDLCIHSATGGVWEFIPNTGLIRHRPSIAAVLREVISEVRAGLRLRAELRRPAGGTVRARNPGLDAGARRSDRLPVCRAGRGAAGRRAARPGRERPFGSSTPRYPGPRGQGHSPVQQRHLK